MTQPTTPVDGSKLVELAERCRQGSCEEAGRLIEEAWEASAQASAEFRRYATRHLSGFDNNAGRFGMLLDARAHYDAALMLVPDDMRDEMETTTLYCVARVTINMNHGGQGSPFYGENVCNYVPLAIADAALRARATQDQEHGQ
jgi:hypothetical protein